MIRNVRRRDRTFQGGKDHTGGEADVMLILRDGHVPTTSRWSSKSGWLQPFNVASSWCRMDQRRLQRAAGSRRGQLCEGRLGTGCFGNGLEVHFPVGVHGHNISKSYYGWSGLFGVGVAGVAASSVEGDVHLDNPSCTGGKVLQPSDKEQDSVAKTLGRWFGWPGACTRSSLARWDGAANIQTMEQYSITGRTKALYAWMRPGTSKRWKA